MGRVVVQTFDEALRPIMGVPHALCVFRETCGDVLALEHDGSLYACDHFVDPEHRLGTLAETPFAELVAREALERFGGLKRTTLPRACQRCDLLASCNGGCPKDRIVPSPDGGPPTSCLCPPFKRFFPHARPLLEQLAAHLRQGRPQRAFAPPPQPAEAKPSPRVGRNDPCPCGSGLKHKRCCLRTDPSRVLLPGSRRTRSP